MGAASLKLAFAPELGRHDWQFRPAPETAACGVAQLDGLISGLPRGCLTEIFGPASSGRVSLLTSILAQATGRGETCVLVDAEDAFDPRSAAASGVRLEHLLWVCCNHDAERALKAADLLIHGGGFGVVAMDLGDTPARMAQRISLTSWFRLRRAVEHTPTVFVVLSRQSNAKTCASLMLECNRKRTEWSGVRGVSRLLCGATIEVVRRKPSRMEAADVRLSLR